MAKVLVYCQDTIGRTMAGPGIRSWEFAKSLSGKHEVTLAAPNEPDIASDSFVIRSYEPQGVTSVLPGHDVIVTQRVTPALAYLAKRTGVGIVVDSYDPVLLEALEVFRHVDIKIQRRNGRTFQQDLKLAMLSADAIICASEKQRDLWLGSLMTVGRLTPDAYAEDHALRQLIDVVPFGVQDDEPVKTGPGFRQKLGIAPDDKVVLWGGGIWNWFDPLTLIRAINEIAQRRSDVKLVFMGLKQEPDPAVADHRMAAEAVRLAKDLGLYGSTVFFNYEWVPYGERQNHLLEADLGVSTHFDHLETRFSFRTRMLDYFWARLPIVATEGDSIAELIAARGLGRVVGYGDVPGLATAIASLLDDPAERAAIQSRLDVIRDEFRSGQVTKALDRQIEKIVASPGQPLHRDHVVAMSRSYWDYLRRLQVDAGVSTPFRAATHAARRVARARLAAGKATKEQP